MWFFGGAPNDHHASIGVGCNFGIKVETKKMTYLISHDGGEYTIAEETSRCDADVSDGCETVSQSRVGYLLDDRRLSAFRGEMLSSGSGGLWL